MEPLPPSTSPAGSLNAIDYKKTIRGAAVVFIATVTVAAAYGLTQYAQTGNLGKFEDVRVILVPIAFAVWELARRWGTNHKAVIVQPPAEAPVTTSTEPETRA
jgi:hypothetical protein